MNAESRATKAGPPQHACARAAGGACTFRPWRRGEALRIGVLAASVALAGCAGLPGATSPGTGTSGAAAPGGTTVETIPPGAAVTLNPAAPFTAGVSLVGASPVRLGDAVVFLLSAGQAGYGSLYMLNASGKVVALVENLPVSPGAPALFPAPDAGFAIRATPPAGTDRVLFLVTLQPFQGLGGGGAPVTLPVQGYAFVADLNAATARLPANGWALAEVRVEVVAGG